MQAPSAVSGAHLLVSILWWSLRLLVSVLCRTLWCRSGNACDLLYINKPWCALLPMDELNGGFQRHLGLPVPFVKAHRLQVLPQRVAIYVLGPDVRHQHSSVHLTKNDAAICDHALQP